MISPARQRAYENWRRSVPSTTSRTVFDSAFDDVKARAVIAIVREMTFASLLKACGRPSSIVLTAALQELIDENAVRELMCITEPRYAPVKAKTTDSRSCRRIWATDEELVAIHTLLESMRCPTKT